MTRWNSETKRSELEAYEVDAYLLGRSLTEAKTHRAHVVRREVVLDEQGRPVRLIEEVIDYEEDI